MKGILERLEAGLATRSAEETRAIAAALAREVPDDGTLALHGDLGAGKTTFVQGLAAGLGVAGPVTSPTFNVFRTYRPEGAGRRMLGHLDAYRLEDPGQIEELLIEEFLVSPYCLAVEWPERVAGWIPAGAWRLDFAIAGDGAHTIRLLARG
jgi:tRNA threonylcarbamoyladenosine biosynthesis protein TsaE